MELGSKASAVGATAMLPWWALLVGRGSSVELPLDLEDEKDCGPDGRGCDDGEGTVSPRLVELGGPEESADDQSHSHHGVGVHTPPLSWAPSFA